MCLPPLPPPPLRRGHVPPRLASPRLASPSFCSAPLPMRSGRRRKRRGLIGMRLRMMVKASTVCLAFRQQCQRCPPPLAAPCRGYGLWSSSLSSKSVHSSSEGYGDNGGEDVNASTAPRINPRFLGSTSCAATIDMKLSIAKKVAGAAPHPNITGLSPSMFSDFRRCPALFRYRYIERLREEVNLPMIRGVLTHQALARLFDLPRNERTITSLTELFQEAWRSTRIDPRFAHLFKGDDSERTWAREAMSLLARYMLLEQPATFDPIWREHKVILSYTVDDAPQGVTPPTYGLNITGVLDRLDRREDGKLVVLDYKTGKAPSLKYSARANRRIVNEKFDQLRIYALLVAKELGEDPAEMEIIYLGEPTRVLMEFTRDQLVDTERRVWQTWNGICDAIEKDHFPAVPHSICPWCSMRNVCPAFLEGRMPAAEETTPSSALGIVGEDEALEEDELVVVDDLDGVPPQD